MSELIEDMNNIDNNQNGRKEDRQEMFESTFDKLMGEFGKACAEEGVSIAIAIAQHPKFKDPMVFYKGSHIIDAAAMMAKILRDIKTEIYNDLDSEPR